MGKCRHVEMELIFIVPIPLVTKRVSILNNPNILKIKSVVLSALSNFFFDYLFHVKQKTQAFSSPQIIEGSGFPDRSIARNPDVIYVYLTFETENKRRSTRAPIYFAATLY